MARRCRQKRAFLSSALPFLEEEAAMCCAFFFTWPDILSFGQTSKDCRALALSFVQCLRSDVSRGASVIPIPVLRSKGSPCPFPCDFAYTTRIRAMKPYQHLRQEHQDVEQRVGLFWAAKKGWAVEALTALSKGTAVCNFTGEMVRREEARQRREKYGKAGVRGNYILTLREHTGCAGGNSASVATIRTTVDATKYGGTARFLNHCCDPNLKLDPYHHSRSACLLPYLTFVACRDIEPGEELSFDYREGAEIATAKEGDSALQRTSSNSSKCLCGSSNCRGFMPSDVFFD